jgi:deoxyribonuclease IV
MQRKVGIARGRAAEAMTHIFGSHTVDNGGIDMAVRRSWNAGLRTVQIFTAIPKFYGDKSTIRAERVQRFRAALEETGMRAEHVVVHAAYVLSCATAEPDKWARAAAGLAKEMERSTTLGVGGVCFHPGSASDGDPEAAAGRVARAMTRALEGSSGGTRLLVENTAGAGKTLGRTAHEVGSILSHIPAELRPRAGYGLDTCHLFASGYDITTSARRFTEILDEFEEATGEPPAFFHLNDSEGELGSNRDRHTLLGDGRIGTVPFRWLLSDRRTRGIPLILETPQQNYDVPDDDPSGDPWDVRMAELLASLA